MASEEPTRLKPITVHFAAADLAYLEEVAAGERSNLSNVIRRIVGKRVDELRAAEGDAA